MTINDTFAQQFVQGLEQAEGTLQGLLFQREQFQQKGVAYWVLYRKDHHTTVEFLFGPSDWDVEMLVSTTGGKFAFKDLLAEPAIAQWVSRNLYTSPTGRNVSNEVRWFVDLLKMALLIIE
jgi:hypothetical protein